MESNFIKERIVVREEIIKKNLEAERKSSGKSKASSSHDILATPPARVVAFEELVNERLRQDLVDLSKQVDRTCETIANYLKVKAAVKVLKGNTRDVRVQTNLGCNFYAQCHVDDASKIFLCVGKDYFLHVELDEALKMIDFKEKQWTKELDVLQEKASKIKAYIKIALEATGRLYDVDREELTRADDIT